MNKVLTEVIKLPESIPTTTRTYKTVKLPTVVPSEKWLKIKKVQNAEEQNVLNKL